MTFWSAQPEVIFRADFIPISHGSRRLLVLPGWPARPGTDHGVGSPSRLVVITGKAKMSMIMLSTIFTSVLLPMSQLKEALARYTGDDLKSLLRCFRDATAIGKKDELINKIYGSPAGQGLRALWKRRDNIEFEAAKKLMKAVEAVTGVGRLHGVLHAADLARPAGGSIADSNRGAAIDQEQARGSVQGRLIGNPTKKGNTLRIALSYSRRLIVTPVLLITYLK